MKRLTNRPVGGSNEVKKQLRMEVVCKLIRYLERGYMWVWIDEVEFEVVVYGVYGYAGRRKKRIGNCMWGGSD